jgi:ABC-type nitrate/sulfonate/bicarbonate transport system substrate-binding protein
MEETMSFTRISRREFLGYGRYVVAGAGLAVLPGRRQAVAQPLKKIKFTLPWVPEGSNLYSFVAKNKGFWRKRGLDVEVFKGSGSLAATQALGTGQFDFGHAVSSVIILQISKGLPLTSIGQLTYRNTMGVGVLADSPIKTPKDLEGKTVGWTPTSGEVPFFPVFARNTGIDEKKIKFVNMNIEVRYRALMEKQIDAMTDFGVSAIPPLVTQGFPVRFMLYSNHGMNMYESSLMAPPKTVKENPELCQAVVDGALEAVAFTYANLEESLDIFLREVREAGLTSKGRDNVRLGLGIFQFSSIADEPQRQGLGFADPKKYAEMNDLVATYLTKSGKKPDVDELFTNRFAGQMKLTEAQWADARRKNEEFAKFFV